MRRDRRRSPHRRCRTASIASTAKATAAGAKAPSWPRPATNSCWSEAARMRSTSCRELSSSMSSTSRSVRSSTASCSAPDGSGKPRMLSDTTVAVSTSSLMSRSPLRTRSMSAGGRMLDNISMIRSSSASIDRSCSRNCAATLLSCRPRSPSSFRPRSGTSVSKSPRRDGASGSEERTDRPGEDPGERDADDREDGQQDGEEDEDRPEETHEFSSRLRWSAVL